MKRLNRYKFSISLALSMLASTISMSAYAAVNSLSLQLVYDSSTLHISPPAFPGTGSFAGGPIQVLARIYPGGTFKDCSQGCGFVNGLPVPGSIGVMTCRGVVLTAALDPILQNFSNSLSLFQAAVQGVLNLNTDTPFVLTTHLYDFGASIDPVTGHIIHAPGKAIAQNILMSDGYLSVYPDGDPRVNFRPILGGVGSFNGLNLTGANGMGAYTVLGFFDNGSRFLTENVTFTFASQQNQQK